MLTIWWSLIHPLAMICWICDSFLIIWSSEDYLIIIFWSSDDIKMIIIWSYVDSLTFICWSSYHNLLYTDNHVLNICWPYVNFPIVLYYDHELIFLWSSVKHLIIICWSSGDDMKIFRWVINILCLSDYLLSVEYWRITWQLSQDLLLSICWLSDDQENIIFC